MTFTEIPLPMLRIYELLVPILAVRFTSKVAALPPRNHRLLWGEEPAVTTVEYGGGANYLLSSAGMAKSAAPRRNNNNRCP